MGVHTKRLARCAVLTALGTVLVYLASMLPSGRLALVAVAGLVGAAAVIHCGGKAAAGVFVVSALLSFLLSPDKGNALMYAAFLGYYPALKSLIERLRSLVAVWAVKLVLANGVFALLWFLARAVLLDGTEIQLPLWLFWIGLNVVFVIYDIGLSRLIYVYVRRFAGKMGK